MKRGLKRQGAYLTIPKHVDDLETSPKGWGSTAHGEPIDESGEDGEAEDGDDLVNKQLTPKVGRLRITKGESLIRPDEEGKHKTNRFVPRDSHAPLSQRNWFILLRFKLLAY